MHLRSRVSTFRINPLSFVVGPDLYFQYRRRGNVVRLSEGFWARLRTCYQLPTLAPRFTLPEGVDIDGLVRIGLITPQDRIEEFLRREREVCWWGEPTPIHYVLAAHKSGATYWFEHDGSRPILFLHWGGGQVLQGGSLTTFDGHSFAFEPFGPATLARSKAATHTFLSAMGFGVPHQIAVDRTWIPDRWTQAASRLLLGRLHSRVGEARLPAVVKPGNLSLGAGFTIVHTATEITRALVRVAQRFRDAPYFVVESFEQGREWRITVVEDGSYAAYQRIRYSVVGNGKASIRDLIRMENGRRWINHRRRGYLRRVTKLRLDRNLRKVLAAQQKRLDYIPRPKERIILATRPSAAEGGLFVDATQHLTPTVVERFQKLRQAMSLSRAGIDAIGPGLESLRVLEVNGRPHLWPHVEPDEGRRRPVAEAMVKLARSNPLASTAAHAILSSCRYKRPAAFRT